MLEPGSNLCRGGRCGTASLERLAVIGVVGRAGSPSPPFTGIDSMTMTGACDRPDSCTRRLHFAVRQYWIRNRSCDPSAAWPWAAELFDIFASAVLILDYRFAPSSPFS